MKKCYYIWSQRLRIRRNAKVGAKSPLNLRLKCSFWVLLGCNLKNIAICEISTLKFVKIEMLASTMNFSIGSIFPKGPGLGLGKYFIKYSHDSKNQFWNKALNYSQCLQHSICKISPHEYYLFFPMLCACCQRKVAFDRRNLNLIMLPHDFFTTHFWSFFCIRLFIHYVSLNVCYEEYLKAWFWYDNIHYINLAANQVSIQDEWKKLFYEKKEIYFTPSTSGCYKQ